jgi:hypothetical protein
VLADYYGLVSRAVRALHPSVPDEGRHALYERARTALVNQLQSVQPPIEAAEITRERLALEAAIRKVESEAVERARRHSSTRTSRSPAIEVTSAVLSIEQNLERLLERAPRQPALPPIAVIPEQNEGYAISFRASRRGPLDLSPDPPKDPHDPEQSQLYARIRQQLGKIKEDIPSQERAQIDAVVDDFLEQPPTWQQVEFKKVLWLCGNALRSTLAQHDAIKDSPDPHYSKLPPVVAEALRRPVEAWNVFVLGDPDLVKLDEKRLGPQEQQAVLNSIKAAKPIIENAANDRDITTEQAGKVLNASLRAASKPGDNINAKQAQALADGTSKNLIAQLLRRAYLTCKSLIDPQTDEDRALVLEYTKGIAKAAGAATFSTAVGAMVVAAKCCAPHAISFFEFVAAHGQAIKEYTAIAFQNQQLGQIIDTVEYVRGVLRNANEANS